MRPEANNSRRGTRARSCMMIVAALGVLVTLVAGAGTSAQAASSSSTQDWLNRINSLRASHGLNALILDGNLSDLAQQRSEINAQNGTLVHTPNLAAGVTSNWQKLGENIGVGQDRDTLWTAFLNSPHHLANLIDPAYTHVGIGEVVVNGTIWVTHRFMRMAPAPAPAATPAPAPAASAPVYVVPTPSSAPRPSSSGTNGNGSGSGRGASQPASAPTGTATSGAAGGDAPPADDGATASDPRSPDHVAAVVNVLKALEQ